MSQAKVDRYKEEKANRKKVMARNKVFAAIGKVVACLVVVALVGWAGTSIYTYYESKKPAETFQINTDSIDDYLNGLSSTEAE